MAGLHRVREKIEFRPRDSCIPPDLFANYSDTSFWARPKKMKRRECGSRERSCDGLVPTAIPAGVVLRCLQSGEQASARKTGLV